MEEAWNDPRLILDSGVLTEEPGGATIGPMSDSRSCLPSKALGCCDGKVIFPRSGGHPDKLGMVRAEVRDGRQATGVHKRVQGRGGAAGDGGRPPGEPSRQGSRHPRLAAAALAAQTGRAPCPGGRNEAYFSSSVVGYCRTG